VEKLKQFGICQENSSIQEITIYGIAYLYTLIDNKISNYFKDFDLSPAKFNTLMIIEHEGKENGLSQVDICKKLLVTASNITKLLDRLDKDGLIIKHTQKGDRRVNLIKISKKGSELLDRAWPGYIKLIKELSGLINSEELNLHSQITLKWIDSIN